MLSKSEIKYIQSLFQKKYREAENSYLIEGPKIVDEALKSAGTVVKKIFASTNWVHQHQLLYPQIQMIAAADFELQKISQLKTPNQVVAIVEKPTRLRPDAMPLKSLTLVLDGIQDPGNLGTIIRTADWFGVPQVICSPDCADIYNSKVVQATMGSLFRIPVYYVSVPEWLSTQQTEILGAVLDGAPLKKIKPVKTGILIIGNESKGIRADAARFITQKITIERTGNAESLNAAVATGILLSRLK
ncbi:tRNA methyltransferase [Niabella ginsenosidivorans]|uniref:tRNA methyltransferase n=1 Tax=Niabella ginsenosidivorans TaxID=1176587 RepID=A0A1A9I4W4_9BACT|nr:RNA methyltransferase [Niabella ginsenosidivorans]ANH82676.1 tRNA methyltransferase [Niabella ginsenosidivorans]